jgi:hypothetical protein
LPRAGFVGAIVFAEKKNISADTPGRNSSLFNARLWGDWPSYSARYCKFCWWFKKLGTGSNNVQKHGFRQ